MQSTITATIATTTTTIITTGTGTSAVDNDSCQLIPLSFRALTVNALLRAPMRQTLALLGVRIGGLVSTVGDNDSCHLQLLLAVSVVMAAIVLHAVLCLCV